MAVRNEWASALVAAGKKESPAKASGNETREGVVTFAIAAADSDASIIKIAKVPANAIMREIKITSDALTGCTSVDVGLYKESGVVADKDIFLAAEDIAAGQAVGSEQNGMEDVALADLGKRLYELLGLTASTSTESAYDLALTFNTIGSGAGNITVQWRYILG